MMSRCLSLLLLLPFFLCLFMSPSEGRKILTYIDPWKKTGCIPELIKEDSHYICGINGSIVCLPGYTGERDTCNVPICDPPCVEHQGNCSAPNRCQCEIGWQGFDCSTCICLPGCVNGYCNKPFDCICEEGWQGPYCDKPICKEGCIHGTCSFPGGCHCHPGWRGENCDECIPLPDCVNGYCEEPLQCKCHDGYKGSFCQTPICSEGCHKTYGFCTVPGECWCRPGFTGPRCDVCATYPGCDHGFCRKPWDCICDPGYTGTLCNQPVGVVIPARERPPVRDTDQSIAFDFSQAPQG